MLTLRSVGFSTLWLALTLAVTGCGGGGGGGGSSSGDKDGPGPVDPKPLAELVRIEVTPVDQSLPAGTSQQYAATGVYSDSTSRDLTGEVTWSSADATTASVDAAGKVKGEAEGGPVAIIATLDDVSGHTDVTISDAVLTALDVTPPTASVPAGLTRKFTATGTYSDGSTLDISDQVDWQSSDEDVATLDASGLATALEANPAITVTASLATFSDTAALTVTAATLQSIEVTASSYSIAAGFNQDYAAIGHYSDGSTQPLTAGADWSSTNQTVATVIAGKVKGLAKGSATIEAAFDGVSGSHGVTVTDALLQTLSVSAPNASLAAGYPQQYSAEGHYSDGSAKDLTSQVVWTIVEDTVATVSNDPASKGLVKALAVGGPIDVSAASGDVVGKATLTVTMALLTSIDVDALNDSLAVGSPPQQYAATGRYSDGSSLDLTQDVTWDSSADAIAEISNAPGSKGLATAMSAGGPIQISASYNPGSGEISASRSLTVTAATLVEIVVTSDNETLFNGLKQQYTATGVYSDSSEADLTQAVTWSVDTDAGTTVASISNAEGSKGLLTTLAEGGPVNVVATLGAVSGNTSLTVDPAVLVSLTLVPMAHQLPTGLTVQYQVIGTYSDDVATEIDLTNNATWSSSDPAIASISNADGSQGEATGVSLGSVTITATVPGVPPVDATLTVTDAVLTTLMVSPESLDLPRGVSQQYTATATFSDASIQDVTHQVEWTSSDVSVATIDSQGMAKTLATGSVTISATLAAFSPTPATAALTVNNLILSSLEIRPDEATCGRTQRIAMKAFVVYNDGTEQDLTTQARWTSSVTSRFSIGLFTGQAKATGNPKALGLSVITARLLGKTDTADLYKIKAKTACTATP